MSDEIHVQSAFRHAADTAQLPWQSQSPDEFVMMLEDDRSDDVDIFPALADFHSALLGYLFADGQPLEWRAAGRRAWSFLRAAYPEEYCRRSASELDGFTPCLPPVASFPLKSLLEQLEPIRPHFFKVVERWFSRRKTWLRPGIGNAYLLARHFQPYLLKVGDGGEFSYEKIAQVFGEIPTPPPGAPPEWCPDGLTPSEWLTQKNRSRSRWSARAQILMVRPLEQQGYAAPALFGEKTPRVRKLYQAAQIGNTNRRGGKNAPATA